MSDEQDPKAAGNGPTEPNPEELRAQLEEEMKRITVRDLLLQSCVGLANLGFSRLGLNERTREMRDLGQARTAIEALRAVLPLLESEKPEEVKPLRDGLAQMQMAYAQVAAEPGGPGGGGGASDEGAPDAGEGGSAGGDAAREGAQPPPAEAVTDQASRPKTSGRIWVPPGSKT